MSLDWLLILILANLLLLPVLGGILYWVLSWPADSPQGRPPPYNAALSDQSAREERNDAQQNNPPEEPTPNEPSMSSSCTSEPDGDCERRLRLVRALYFLRGRLEQQGRELLPFERQTINEATCLLAGGDCVNDARLFLSPEGYPAPCYLDYTYEEQFMRIYGLSPSYVLAHSSNKDLADVTNQLGDLTRDGRLEESEIACFRWDVGKAQSLLISGYGGSSIDADPCLLQGLSALSYEINAKYRYLHAVASCRQQHFEVLPFWRPQQRGDWEQPDPHSCDPDGWWIPARQSNGPVRETDTRPRHLVEQMQGARQYAGDQYPVQPEPSRPPPMAQPPAAIDYGNPLSPEEPNPRPFLPPQPPSALLSQIPTIPSRRDPHTSTESRRRPSTIPHHQSPHTSAAPQPVLPSRDPTPPLMEGPTRTGRTFRFEDLLGAGRGGKQKEKKGKRRKQE